MMQYRWSRRWWVAIPVLCMGALVSFAFLHQGRPNPAAPPLHFPAIARIDLTYTPPEDPQPTYKLTITRYITDAATIHRFTTAFAQLHGTDSRVLLYDMMCSLAHGEDATLSVGEQTFHVIYGCGVIWTGPYEYVDTAGIETMARHAAMSYSEWCAATPEFCNPNQYG